jgi:hypothetical protein
MTNWMEEKQRSDAARKAEEAAAVAAFVAAGKVKHCGYADEKAMKRVQKNWNRDISPRAIEERKEDEQFRIFAKDGSVKA